VISTFILRERNAPPGYERVHLPGKSARTKRVMYNEALMRDRHGAQQRYRTFTRHIEQDFYSNAPIERRVYNKGTVSRI